MNYDNINISSNSIIFNPENGKMTSNELTLKYNANFK